MSDTPAEPGAMSTRLQVLAAQGSEPAAPYDFAEFQRRAALRGPGVSVGSERLWRGLRAAAVIAPVGLLSVIALVTRPWSSDLDGTSVIADAVPPAVELSLSTAPAPALVRAGDNGGVLALEDRVALFDELLSQASMNEVPEIERSALQNGRNTLADSLQRVRYAQTLLAY